MWVNPFRCLRPACLVGVLALGMAWILAGCSAPQAVYEPTSPIHQPTSILPQPTEVIPPPQPTAVPVLPEYRMVTLEWPEAIRAGDGDEIRLTLEIDDRGNVIPTAEVEGNVVTGEVVEIPDLYETHLVFAEARLDMAGLEVEPRDLVIQPLLPGHTATFYWSVNPEAVATYKGRVWLYLRFKDKVTGEESQRPIYSQQIEIRATTFFGLNGTTARVAGGVGSLVGSVLSLDKLAPHVFKRMRGKPSDKQAKIKPRSPHRTG